MATCSWTKDEFDDDLEYLRHNFDQGIYVCVKCGNELFNSVSKYKHDSPWPAFTRTIREDSLLKIPESEIAIKVLCGKCKHPLGHEFPGDGPKAGTSRF